MKIIKSEHFGQWELRANGVTQSGRTFKSTVAMLRKHGDSKQEALKGANLLKQTEIWFSSDGKYKVSQSRSGGVRDWGAETPLSLIAFENYY